jgi:hypothetical protein
MKMPTATSKTRDLKRLSAPGLRAFFRIADLWELNRKDQMAILGLTATSTYQKYKAASDVRLNPSLLERISYVLGIYKALQILFPDATIADSWVRRPNTGIPFDGKTPLHHMAHGKVQNLIEVRDYLDSHLGT